MNGAYNIMVRYCYNVFILYIVRPSGSGVMSWTCDPALALGLRLKFDSTLDAPSAPISLAIYAMKIRGLYAMF